MIGVFDSGVGGLSVWKELIKELPQESYIYVADSGNCPYGPKSKAEVISRAVAITNYLISKGAQIIVIACNTATAGAIEYLRANYSIPFVGMEPAVKPAAINSKTGVIGVLATKGTFKGELYIRTLHKFAAETIVLEQVGEGLVELVEQGKTESEQAYKLISSYVLPMIEQKADHIVLGCTHYPFLTNVIEKVTEGKITILNPAPAVARRAKEILLSIREKNVENKISEAVVNNESVECECNIKAVSNTFVTTGNNIDLIKCMVKKISQKSFESSNFSTIVL